MHFVLLISILVSLLWGFITVVPFLVEICGWSVPSALLCIVLVDVFWGVSTAYLIDLFSSHLRKNNEFLRSFYAELHADLIVLLVFAVVLFVIFALATTRYSLSNIDIACLGIPLLIYAIDSLAKAKDPTGTLTISLDKRLMLLFLPVCLLLLSSWALIRIYSGSVPPWVSLWLQLNILAAGFSSYVGAKQFCYFLKHRRLGVSPTLMTMFAKFHGGRPGIYDLVAELERRFERSMRKAAAQAATERQRERKAGKKRKRRR